ncbi:hypothetical protein [Arthrobacter sp. CP30]
MTRIGWGLADQSVSSLTNFAVGILIARSVPIDEFGAYALVFALFCIVLSVSRALVTEPFAVRFTKASPGDDPRRALEAGLGTTAALGVLLGAGLVLSSFLLPEPTAGLVLVLGFILPGLLVQDAVRLIFFALGQGRRAFINDLLWAVLLVPGFVLALATPQPTAAQLFLAWGGAATIAGLTGLATLRCMPRVGASLSWCRTQRDLWPRYVVEGLAITGSSQATTMLIGVSFGLAAAGEFKLVMVVLGPVNVLVQGIGAVAVPEAVKAMAGGRPTVSRLALALSLIVGCGAAAWGIAVSLAPDSIMSALAGPSWMAAAALLLPLCLTQVLNGLNTGPVVALRAFRAARRSMWMRILTSCVVLVFVSLAMLGPDAATAAWALSAAAGVNMMLWVVLYHRTVLVAAPPGQTEVFSLLPDTTPGSIEKTHASVSSEATT